MMRIEQDVEYERKNNIRRYAIKKYSHIHMFIYMNPPRSGIAKRMGDVNIGPGSHCVRVL